MMDKNLSDKKKIRCAIYTRKSCEEGLEQEFNSLDAQRVSAENYIASQSMQGWVLIPTYYDDGGYSGGNIERPALQRLFADIREDKIDIVIVYKIDRLTRSLFDFSKIIEIFDHHKVSFVSVTQSFNTANSMGRLMLNVLLSFAQYERELTGERIRDKVDASKKKGMWMGGNIPFGYDVNDRKLIINKDEAKIIRTLFDTYLETNSIIDTARSLNNSGFRTKSWVSRKGKVTQGAKFDKQIVRRILEFPLYNGKIKHKDKVYTGQHEAIIGDDIWQRVQDILKDDDNRNKISIPKSRVTVSPLLKGVLYCNQCNGMMTPTYTIKNGKRYRYYICTSKLVAKNESCRVGRITAHEIEESVTDQILQYLKKPEFIIHTMRVARDKLSENAVIDAFKNLERVWDELFPVERARIVNLLVKNIVVMDDGLSINLFKDGIYSLSTELTN